MNFHRSYSNSKYVMKNNCVCTDKIIIIMNYKI